MSYLLDKKEKRKKFVNIAFGIVAIFFLFYFKSPIFNGLSYTMGGIFRPVLVTGNNIGEKFKSVGSYFSSKNSLYLQNKSLESKLNEEEVRMSNYNAMLADNQNIKEVLGRKNEKTSMVLAAILSKPNQSIYDTLLINAGTQQGIKVEDVVFAMGNIPIGRVALVYANSSKVILFSNAGEKTQAVITGKDIFMEVVGRGGGNFEMTVPRDLSLVKGDQVVIPGLNLYVLAIVQMIISDPRDSSTKVLLSSPVNIQELKFVEVEI